MRAFPSLYLSLCGADYNPHLCRSFQFFLLFCFKRKTKRTRYPNLPETASNTAFLSENVSFLFFEKSFSRFSFRCTCNEQNYRRDCIITWDRRTHHCCCSLNLKESLRYHQGAARWEKRHKRIVSAMSRFFLELKMNILVLKCFSLQSLLFKRQHCNGCLSGMPPKKWRSLTLRGLRGRPL